MELEVQAADYCGYDIEETIRVGDRELLHNYLTATKEKGRSIEALRTKRGETLLHFAIRQRPFCDAVVDAVLSFMTPFTTNCKDCPLQAALYLENPVDQLSLLTKLIKAGANMHLLDYKHETILFHFLTSFMYITDIQVPIFSEIFDLFIANGCQVNHKDVDNETAFGKFLKFLPSSFRARNSDVCSRSNEDQIVIWIMKKCLSNKYDVKTRNIYGETLLHHAVSSMRLDICKLLIDAGVEGNVNSAHGGNAMFALLQAQDSQSMYNVYTTADYSGMISLLKQAGVEIDKRANDGSTLLQRALAYFVGPQGPQHHLIEALLSEKASLSFEDLLQNNGYHYAALNPRLRNMLDYLKQSLSQKPAINKSNLFQMTPLHNACMAHGLVPVVELVTLGADPLTKGLLQTSPIHIYSANLSNNYQEQVLEQLLSFGVDINHQDCFGATPLHYAAFLGQPNMVEILLKYGADTVIKNNAEERAYDVAYKYGRIECMQLLGAEDKTDYELCHKEVLLSDIGLYTSKLKRYIKQQYACGKNINDILRIFGIKQTDSHTSSYMFLRKTVETFCEEVVKTIGELDQRFSGKLISSGSSFEGVKVGLPDEFDFMVELSHFSDRIGDVVFNQTSGTVNLNAFNKHQECADYSRYVTEDGHLNSVLLILDFSSLLQQAVRRVYKKGFKNMIQNPTTLYYMNVAGIEENQLVCCEFLWLCEEYKFMQVSVDINPVLFVNTWPDELLKESSLYSNITESGLYLIPKYMKRNTVPFEVDFSRWRLSFSHIETTIFQRLGNHLREAFSFIKSIRMKPMCPAIRYGEVSLSLKTFQDLAARWKAKQEECKTAEEYCKGSSTELLLQHLKNQQNNRLERVKRKYKLSGDDSEENAEEIQTDDSDATEKDEFEIAEDNTSSDAHLVNGSDDDPNGDFEEDSDSDTCENLDDDSDGDCTDFQYEDGEYLIKTYSLKQEFFRVVETLMNDGKDPESLHKVDIAIMVYQNLLEGFTNQEVMSYFNPGQNLYFKWQEEDDEGATQIAMCEHIIKILHKIKQCESAE